MFRSLISFVVMFSLVSVADADSLRRALRRGEVVPVVGMRYVQVQTATVVESPQYQTQVLVQPQQPQQATEGCRSNRLMPRQSSGSTVFQFTALRSLPIPFAPVVSGGLVTTFNGGRSCQKTNGPRCG